MGYHQFYSIFMCQSKLSSAITFSRYVTFCCSWVLSIFTIYYEFSNSVNDLFFWNILLFLSCCLSCCQQKLYLIKIINFGINFVNIINESKYIFFENIMMINISWYYLFVFQKCIYFCRYFLVILFTEKKCHEYIFLMFFTLLDLLVKSQNRMAEELEQKLKEVRRREEEVERREEEPKRRVRVVSPLNGRERRRELFTSK